MLEFCTCGSIIIDSQCTNKNCPSKVSVKSSSTVQKKTTRVKSTEVKSPKSRRASKVITYNLNDTEEEQ